MRSRTPRRTVLLRASGRRIPPALKDLCGARRRAVWTNDISYSYYFAQAPWGGRKSSGYGRTHGLEGLRELVSPKYVDSDSGRVAVPWWYPYRREGVEGLKGGLELLYRKGALERGRGAAAQRRGLAHLTRRYLGARMTEGLSHLDESGRVQMVDVGGKPMQQRRATATATVRMAQATVERLRELPKGDALACAEVAGIMAAKRTSDLIPLCHPLPLTHVSVKAEPGRLRPSRSRPSPRPPRRRASRWRR